MAPKDAAPDTMPELAASSIFDLSGKVGLVTGGGTGIGKMIAASYIRNGAKIYIASRKLGDLKKQAEALSKLSPPGKVNGPACIALEADVSTKAGCDALANQIKEKESNLDILVNNAGLTWGAPMDDFPEAKGWDKTFAMNDWVFIGGRQHSAVSWGLFDSSQYCLSLLNDRLLPLLEKDKTNEKHASVINIASVAAYSPVAESGLAEPGHGTWSYQPSKAASVHLTRTMANSLADKFVLVNAICPGVFPSKMTAYGLSENKDILEGIQPTGRVGSPQDIGGVAILLASRAGSHMTGNAVILDGGQTLQFSARL